MLKELISKIRKQQNAQLIEAQTPLSQSVSAEFSDQLTYGAQTVGFIDMYSQEYIYRNILSTVGKTDSIIDFGCGRGDLFNELLQSERDISNYLGIEISNVLYTVGKSKYPNINVLNADWFTLDSTIVRDWAIAVSSFDVIYSPTQAVNPYGYICDSIELMLQHARKGVIVTFLKQDLTLDSNILSYDFGIILNRILKNHNFILDASSIPNTYKLIILKPYEY